MNIIDSDNYAAAGVQTFFFPGGEPHARLPDNFDAQQPTLLVARMRTWNDVGIAACVLDALRQAKCQRIGLFAPYFPAARQDRTDGRTPLTMKMIIRLLEGTVDTPHTFDLHNPAVVYGVRNWLPHDLGLPVRPDIDVVVAPDIGAAERAFRFREAYCPNAQLLRLPKKRDFATGKLGDYDLTGITIDPAKRYLVVDDICDGGYTFILLADAMRKHAAGEALHLELFVSHGIFSKSLVPLLPHYRHIYTTDSWCQLTNHRLLTVYPLQPIIDRIAKEFA